MAPPDTQNASNKNRSKSCHTKFPAITFIFYSSLQKSQQFYLGRVKNILSVWLIPTFVVAGNPFNILCKRHLPSNQISEHPDLKRQWWLQSGENLAVLFLLSNGTSASAFVSCTRRSGQLNSSKTSWKSSMAPSVISMMAWLHRLPWPSAAAWEAQSNFISKAGYPVKTQQVSRLFFFLTGTNLIQDLKWFLHCILDFALSFYMKLINQELKVLQRDAQQEKKKLGIRWSAQSFLNRVKRQNAWKTDRQTDRKWMWENEGVRRRNYQWLPGR